MSGRQHHRRASGFSHRELFAGTPLRTPWWALLVPAGAAVGGAVFFAWKPGVGLSVLGSGRALGFTAAVGVLLIGLGWMLPRLQAGRGLTMSIQSVPVAIAFIATVLPAFRTVTVDDPFPDAIVAAPQSASPTPALTAEPRPTPTPLTRASSGQTPAMATDLPSAASTVDAPRSRATSVPRRAPTPPAGNVPPSRAPVEAVDEPRTTTPTPTSTAPVELASGRLRGIDHYATGRVRLIDLGNGETLVRFEDLDVESGPDYFVHVVAGADRTRPGSGTQIAKLRGSRGNQNYTVDSPGVGNRPVTVLIWCRVFAVPVAAVTLR